MPKIIVKEYDNTKPGSVEYSNFAVVVPGEVGDKYPANNLDADGNAIFDENGICECNSLSYFEENIGEADGIVGGEIAPVLLKLGPGYSVTGADIKTTPYDEYLNNGQVYKYELAPAGTNKVGHLIWQNPDGDFIKLTKLVKATDVIDTARYSVIESADKEGTDEHIEQMGNQIAHELLSLGYTVLYKKLTQASELHSSTFWECLKDKSIYDFRYITTGGYCNSSAYEEICKIATFKNTSAETSGRGDCIALIDVIEDGLTGTQSAICTAIKTQVKGWSFADKFTGIFVPHVKYNIAYKNTSLYKDSLTFPGSFHYLACAAKARENYAEWYAIAGYTRGVSDYAITGTTLKLGEVAVNNLESRHGSTSGEKSVNVITKERTGYYLWGSRTAHILSTDTTTGGLVASHFLNIRELCCTLKKELYVTCRHLTFDPNSDILWVNFCNRIRPTLEKMKADQGIKDYKLIKVRNNQKALLTAKVRIVPIEPVEDFEISIFLEDSITGVVASTDEEE